VTKSTIRATPAAAPVTATTTTANAKVKKAGGIVSKLTGMGSKAKKAVASSAPGGEVQPSGRVLRKRG